jgi:hypothetical protein
VVARIETGIRSPLTLPLAAAPSAPVTTQPSSLTAPRLSARWLGLPAALAASAVLYFALGGAAGTADVVIDNQLMSPVWLTIGRQPAQLVPPGDSVRVEWPAGRALAAEWSLVRPVSSAGKPMGDALRGIITVDEPSGSLRRSIDLASAGGPWFAPRITNVSGVPLTIAVETAPGERLCDCEVAATEAPVWLGYYRLGAGTTVRVHDASGRQAVFDGFQGRVDQLGQVALRVEKRDLPYPVARTAPVRAATRSEVYAAKAPPPVVVDEPVLRPVAVVEVEAAMVPVPEPVAAEPPPAPRPAQRNSAPSFLPN